MGVVLLFSCMAIFHMTTGQTALSGQNNLNNVQRLSIPNSIQNGIITNEKFNRHNANVPVNGIARNTPYSSNVFSANPNVNPLPYSLQSVNANTHLANLNGFVGQNIANTPFSNVASNVASNLNANVNSARPELASRLPNANSAFQNIAGSVNQFPRNQNSFNGHSTNIGNNLASNVGMNLANSVGTNWANSIGTNSANGWNANPPRSFYASQPQNGINNVSPLNFSIDGNPFSVISSDKSNPFGLNILADNLEIGGLVSVTGMMPITGTVSVHGTVPTDGAAAVNYGCSSHKA